MSSWMILFRVQALFLLKGWRKYKTYNTNNTTTTKNSPILQTKSCYSTLGEFFLATGNPSQKSRISLELGATLSFRRMLHVQTPGILRRSCRKFKSPESSCRENATGERCRILCVFKNFFFSGICGKLEILLIFYSFVKNKSVNCNQR